MKRLWMTLALALALAASGDAYADSKEDEPEFMRSLFAPELVMENQREIGLSKDQRKRITKAIQELQKDAVDVQWEMLEAMTELNELMEKPRVDPDEAMQKVEKVLGLEARLKTRHLGLLILIKNELSAEQQRKLRALRDEADDD